MKSVFFASLFSVVCLNSIANAEHRTPQDVSVEPGIRAFVQPHQNFLIQSVPTEEHAIFPIPDASDEDSVFVISKSPDQFAMRIFESNLTRQDGVILKEGRLIKTGSLTDAAKRIISLSEKTGKKHFKTLVIAAPGNARQIIFSDLNDINQFGPLLNDAGITFDKVLLPVYELGAGAKGSGSHPMKTLAQTLAGSPEVSASTGKVLFKIRGSVVTTQGEWVTVRAK